MTKEITDNAKDVAKPTRDTQGNCIMAYEQVSECVGGEVSVSESEGKEGEKEWFGDQLVLLQIDRSSHICSLPQ